MRKTKEELELSKEYKAKRLELERQIKQLKNDYYNKKKSLTKSKKEKHVIKKEEIQQTRSEFLRVFRERFKEQIKERQD